MRVALLDFIYEFFVNVSNEKWVAQLAGACDKSKFPEFLSKNM